MYEFKLPDLGEGVHEGEILKWHVQPGDAIQEDEPLVDIETDKAAITIPSPRSGRVASQSGEVGDTVLVGSVIVVIDDGAGAEEASLAVSVTAAASSAESSALGTTRARTNNSAAVSSASARLSVPSSLPSAPAVSWGRVVAAPATRRMARELSIDIRQVPPTGPAGRVTPEDVKHFAGQPDKPGESVDVSPGEEQYEKTDTVPVAPAASAIPFLDLEPLPDFAQWGPVEKEPLRSIRRKVARKMVTSMILVPHVAHMDEVDVTVLEELRQWEKKRRIGQPGGRLTLLPFVVKAVTAGLKAAPAFNASLDPFNEEIVYKKYYNIGVAVDTERGLVVPVIRDTDRKSIMQISAEIEEAVAKARAGQLAVEDLRGGTFTITNIGVLGGTGMIPTINYPEAAILGMGRVQEKPVVVNGKIVIRKMLPLTLAFDHRIADGAEAARFVNGIVQRLPDPNALLLET
ncbi:MAG: 2-oxo acid dehydrogenase subunit E2 [Planctomycetes bacterium]|nr:2-oxo acid dehydrogenase subunit E2 [Planctomycetota bacterium]